MDFRHDEWGVDVTVIGSQKGLMLPPGLGFNALSPKAIAANKTAKLPRGYFEWQPMIDANDSGFFPYTPPIGLVFGLKEAIAILEEEGLDNVFARHDRLAEATRRAVRAWGLDYLSVNPQENSSALTAVMMPEGHDADALRGVILERYDVSLGSGLGKVAGKVFRIGHLGSFNDLMLVATLAGGRDGLGRGRRAVPQGRRRGGAGLSRRQRPGRPRTGARRRRAMNAEGAARLLVAARRSFRPLAGLEGDLSPASDGDAYAVQEATLALLGAREAGWKVGSANPTAAATGGAAHRRARAEKPGALHRAAPRASARSRRNCACCSAATSPPGRARTRHGTRSPRSMSRSSFWTRAMPTARPWRRPRSSPTCRTMAASAMAPRTPSPRSISSPRGRAC